MSVLGYYIQEWDSKSLKEDPSCNLMICWVNLIWNLYGCIWKIYVWTCMSRQQVYMIQCLGRKLLRNKVRFQNIVHVKRLEMLLFITFFTKVYVKIHVCWNLFVPELNGWVAAMEFRTSWYIYEKVRSITFQAYLWENIIHNHGFSNKHAKNLTDMITRCLSRYYK